MNDRDMLEKLIEEIDSKAPPMITRKKLQELSGGAVKEKTLANRDCKGEGILPRYKVCGKVVYPRDAAIAYLKKLFRIA